MNTEKEKASNSDECNSNPFSSSPVYPDAKELIKQIIFNKQSEIDQLIIINNLLPTVTSKLQNEAIYCTLYKLL